MEQRMCSYKKKIHNWGYELNPFPSLLFSASLLPGTNNCVMNLEIEEIKKKKTLVCGNIVICIPVCILLEGTSRIKKKTLYTQSCSGE